MLSVAEAQAIILRHARALAPQETSLCPQALGLVLAEDVASDMDMPPFDKALMDGYAVRCADLSAGDGTLTVIEEVTAGQVPRLSVAAGQATRIMTGAPIPAGADAVVMVERTRALEANRIQIDDKAVKPGQNILVKAREMKRGETVLKTGTVLRPQQFGLLASVGRTAVLAHPAPEVAIISTGDEVVDPSLTPGPGQIRNGNGLVVLGQVSRAGGIPRFLGIARDRLDSLQPAISEGLRWPVLVLSGGVSAGKLDLVPGVLKELGVEAHVYRVEMKPGKPMFFGTRGSTLVFGLPGNPVSTLVCFELFVRPAIRKLMGHANPGPDMVHATMLEDFAHRSDRPTYHPVVLEAGDSGWRIRPVPWFGSADLRALASANAFAVYPAGEHQFRAGERFPVMKVE